MDPKEQVQEPSEVYKSTVPGVPGMCDIGYMGPVDAQNVDAIFLTFPILLVQYSFCMKKTKQQQQQQQQQQREKRIFLLIEEVRHPTLVSARGDTGGPTSLCE